MRVIARLSNWDDVYKFIVDNLMCYRLSEKQKNEICIACEEIYVNISSYAYPRSNGYVNISLFFDESTNNISILFEDEGVKFNPLNVSTPKISGTALERKIGGLGIFMTKKLMSKIEYKYEDGKNKLKLIKTI